MTTAIIVDSAVVVGIAGYLPYNAAPITPTPPETCEHYSMTSLEVIALFNKIFTNT